MHTDFANIDFLEDTMKGYGVPYEIVRIDSVTPVNLTDILWSPSGAPRYAGYVM